VSAVKNNKNVFNVIRKIKGSLNAEYVSETIKRVVVGIYMTAVETSSIGCTYSLRDDKPIPHMNPEIKFAGKIAGMKVSEVIEWFESDSSLERSIAVAAINSCLNRDSEKYLEGDPLVYARDRFTGSKVVMVGHFPFAEEISEWAGEFTILELNPAQGDRNYRDARDKLKDADLTIVTGVTLLNNTFPEVLSLASSSYVIMLGPTVPFSSVLFEHGVNLITSLVVDNSNKLFRSISEGAIVPRYLGGKMMSYTNEKDISLPPGDFRLRLTNQER